MSIPRAPVTGGLGFVGSAIVAALQEHHPECVITSLDIKPPSSAPNRQSNVHYVTADITNPAEALAAV